MSAERKPVDVLDIINRVAIFNGGLIAYDLCAVGERVEELIEAVRAERAARAAYQETAASHRGKKWPAVVAAGDRVDAALAAVRGGA